MAIQELPLEASNPDYTFSTVLDGVEYALTVSWNSRDEAWYLDISDLQENNLVRGLKLLLGGAHGTRFSVPELPVGVFQVDDLSNEHEEAGFDDMGTRVRVFFIPSADLV